MGLEKGEIKKGMRNKISEAKVSEGEKRQITKNWRKEGDSRVRANIPGSAIVLCVCLWLPCVHEMEILDHPRHGDLS